ncbi:MAG: alkaline phosphatase [Desulfobacterales bacterium]
MICSRGKYRTLLFMLLAALCFSTVGEASSTTAKNVIVLIADGCSAEQFTLARWIKKEALSLDRVLVGAVKTHIADSVVADSAPAATAYATGVRTFDKCIGVGPDCLSGSDSTSGSAVCRPMATVLEGAKLLGKATGIVVTSRISHATPAAFAAHVPHRGREEDIAEQIVYQNIDVVFGGGSEYLLPMNAGGKRNDGENLMNVLKKRGVRIVGTAQEMADVHSGSVYGLFSKGHMPAEIDRQNTAPGVPSLPSMTRKALEILSQDPDGFFLMVEGSQIDWACHANDPAHMIGDVLAFEEAASVCLKFAEENGRTLVLALSDHNTGGFSIGNYRTSFSYSQITTEQLLDPLTKMGASAFMLWKRIEQKRTPEQVVSVVKNGWGMTIRPEDGAAVLARADRYRAYGTPHYALGEILCPEYTCIGWSTHGHTGGDVPLYAYGPKSPAGVLDAPDVGRLCAQAMGFDLERTTRRLYADVQEVLPHAGVMLDRKKPANPVLRVQVGHVRYRFFLNKNRMVTPDSVITLEAPVIYMAESRRAYLPMQALGLMEPGLLPLPDIEANSS